MSPPERLQLWFCIPAILLGLAIGVAAGEHAGAFEQALWPALGLLLYATFLQLPPERPGRVLRERRFLAAAVFGNFLAIPLLAWGLVQLVPAEPAVRFGILLVLLVPCTDWFIAFAQMGRGDGRLALALTPANLLLQLLLLPVWLWVFTGRTLPIGIDAGAVLTAFALLVAAPFAAALLTRRAPERWRRRAGRILPRADRATVLLVAAVMFLVAASQAGRIGDAPASLLFAGVAFVAFLVLAAPLAWIVAKVAGLAVPAGRTLAFSFGTRNSFVVLPVALALPEEWRAVVVVVVVLQSLVELFGMLVYLRWVPGALFPDRR